MDQSQFEKIHKVTSNNVDKYLRKLQFTLPILFIILAAAAFTQPIGGLLITVLGLPWVYFTSFLLEPIHALASNVPKFVETIVALIIPLVINAFLLYKLGKHLNKKLADQVTNK